MAHVNADRCIGLGAVQTLTAQAAGTVTSQTLDTHQARGCIIYINVTSLTGTLTVTLQGVDPGSGSAVYTVLASAAIASTGLTVLRVYPGLTAAANAVANDVMPAVSNLKSVVATGPATATVSVQLVY